MLFFLKSLFLGISFCSQWTFRVLPAFTFASKLKDFEFLLVAIFCFCTNFLMVRPTFFIRANIKHLYVPVVLYNKIEVNCIFFAIFNTFITIKWKSYENKQTYPPTRAKNLPRNCSFLFLGETSGLESYCRIENFQCSVCSNGCERLHQKECSWKSRQQIPNQLIYWLFGLCFGSTGHLFLPYFLHNGFWWKCHYLYGE